VAQTVVPMLAYEDVRLYTAEDVEGHRWMFTQSLVG
jgi:hypothetical protein